MRRLGICAGALALAASCSRGEGDVNKNTNTYQRTGGATRAQPVRQNPGPESCPNPVPLGLPGAQEIDPASLVAPERGDALLVSRIEAYVLESSGGRLKAFGAEAALPDGAPVELRCRSFSAGDALETQLRTPFVIRLSDGAFLQEARTDLSASALLFSGRISLLDGSAGLAVSPEEKAARRKELEELHARGIEHEERFYRLAEGEIEARVFTHWRLGEGELQQSIGYRMKAQEPPGSQRDGGLRNSSSAR